MGKWLYEFFFGTAEEGPNHVHFFSVLGYLIMCESFVYAVHEKSGADYMLWLVFGAVVIGNKSLNDYFSSKTPPKQ